VFHCYLLGAAGRIETLCIKIMSFSGPSPSNARAVLQLPPTLINAAILDIELSERVVSYSNFVLANQASVVPVDLQNRFCVLFGCTVLADFQSMAEALEFQDQHMFLVTALYIPVLEACGDSMV
jgi:hypothetical protein